MRVRDFSVELIKKPILWLIKAYSCLISPFLGPCCRFVPTCSAYAYEAVDTHGSIKGLYLAFRRIIQCHPWGKTGFDPVPLHYSQTVKQSRYHERKQ